MNHTGKVTQTGIGAFGVAEAAAAGWTITRRPYASGEAGIKQSLEEVCRLMREARVDPDVKTWAVNALISKGIDGRNRPSIRQQAGALLEVFRGQTIYVPDAAGAEHIQAAHVTLCLRDRCIPGEDCESLVIALGGPMLAIGLPVYGVKVSYGSAHQQHILLGLIDEDDKKFYVDPSTNSKVMDKVPRVVEEIWVDPLDQVGPVGAGAEIVTLGAPMAERELFIHNGVWFEYALGRWWMWSQNRWVAGPTEKVGVGQPFVRDERWWVQSGHTEVELTPHQAQELGLGAPPTSSAPATNTTPPQLPSLLAYQTVTNNQVFAGLRYRLDVSVTTNANPTGTEQTEQGFFEQNWDIETFEPLQAAGYDATTQTFVTPYVLQGIAKQNTTLVDQAMSVSAPGVQYLTVSVQAAQPGVSPGAVTAISSPATPTASNNTSAFAVGGAAVVVGGVSLGIWMATRRRR